MATKINGILQNGKKYKLKIKDLDYISIKVPFIDVDFSPLKEISTVKYFTLSTGTLDNIDLSFLENWINLKTLSLERNKFQTINLKALKFCYSLKELKLSDNKLKSLNFEPLKNLKDFQYLDISNNKLQKLDIEPLSHNVSVSHLDIKNNPISFLDLKYILKMKNLEYLDISPLKMDIDISQFQQLQKLKTFEFNIYKSLWKSYSFEPNSFPEGLKKHIENLENDWKIYKGLNGDLTLLKQGVNNYLLIFLIYSEVNSDFGLNHFFDKNEIILTIDSKKKILLGSLIISIPGLIDSIKKIFKYSNTKLHFKALLFYNMIHIYLVKSLKDLYDPSDQEFPLFHNGVLHWQSLYKVILKLYNSSKDVEIKFRAFEAILGVAQLNSEYRRKIIPILKKIALNTTNDKIRKRVLSNVHFDQEFKEVIKTNSINKIKSTILNLRTQFDRLPILEIAEECGENEDLIIKTIKEMIEKEQIYAKYYESTQSVVFKLKPSSNKNLG